MINNTGTEYTAAKSFQIYLLEILKNNEVVKPEILLLYELHIPSAYT